ncbi:MAG: hypothetical protein FWF71_06365 [Actinomycetia bacterium]|nr:hypothetical protein [Actinomycetes bacterium]
MGKKWVIAGSVCLICGICLVGCSPSGGASDSFKGTANQFDANSLSDAQHDGSDDASNTSADADDSQDTAAATGTTTGANDGTASDGSHTQQPAPGSEGDHADGFSAEAIVSNYLSLRRSAVNSGDEFDKMSMLSLIQPNSVVYQSEAAWLADAVANKTNEQEVDVAISSEAGSEGGTFKVYVTEKLQVKTSEQPEYTNQTKQLVFTVKTTADSIYITDIKG